MYGAVVLDHGEAAREPRLEREDHGTLQSNSGCRKPWQSKAAGL